MARAGLIGLALILVGLQYQLWVGEGSLAQVHRLEQRLHRLQTATKKKKAENRKLAASIKHLKSGDTGVKRLARTEMGYVKSGETFFLTVRSENGRRRKSAEVASRK